MVNVKIRGFAVFGDILGAEEFEISSDAEARADSPFVEECRQEA